MYRLNISGFRTIDIDTTDSRQRPVRGLTAPGAPQTAVFLSAENTDWKWAPRDFVPGEIPSPLRGGKDREQSQVKPASIIGVRNYRSMHFPLAPADSAVGEWGSGYALLAVSVPGPHNRDRIPNSPLFSQVMFSKYLR